MNLCSVVILYHFSSLEKVHVEMPKCWELCKILGRTKIIWSARFKINVFPKFHRLFRITFDVGTSATSIEIPNFLRVKIIPALVDFIINLLYFMVILNRFFYWFILFLTFLIWSYNLIIYRFVFDNCRFVVEIHSFSFCNQQMWLFLK